ncbi:MAG: putative porin [Bacteroidota bacterium]
MASTWSVVAQFPGTNTNPSGGRGGFPSGPRTPQQQGDPSRDTLSQEVYIYYADNASERTLFQDSSLLNFHLYDPVRQGKYEYANLGNLGSAHRQLVYQPRFRRGFDAGFHHYDLYLTRADDIPFYELEKAYSDITFHQSSQEKTGFNANFSKPLVQNTYLGVRYRNIRNTGQYTNQASRTNSFITSFSYQSKNKKYRSYLSFISNTVEQKENGGGILNDGNFRKSILPVGRPVNTNTGESRYFERDLNYTHFYVLEKLPTLKKTKGDSLREMVTKGTEIDSLNLPTQSGVPDFTVPTPPPVASISETGRKFTAKHNLSLRKNTYKYFDESNLNYYDQFLVDDRGVRNYIETDQIENTFSLRTYKLAEKAPNFFVRNKDKSPDQKDLIEVGLTHTFTNINQEPIDSTVNNLFLFGKIAFTPSDRLRINTYGHFGTLRQIGDYYLKGDFLWDTRKLGKIELSVINQLYSPTLFQRSFYVFQQNVWQNDFKKTSETNLSASYSIPKFKVNLTANYHLIGNFIYQDASANPVQADGILNILQLKAENQIDVGRFHLQNTVYLQQASSDVIRFPEIYSIHRLYMDLRLFKVMKTQLGGEVRLNTPYLADNFQPLTGHFFQQNEQEVPLYPIADVFLNFRIQQFRFFLIIENLYDYFTPNFHYTSYPYAIPDSQMRFGFRWLFLD